MQHHCGGQAGSADDAQAGGGTADLDLNLDLIFFNLLEADPCLSVLQIDTKVCPRRILISNLPRMDTETLLNKLEIHFSKRKNRGGEVDDCEMMTDSWTVVLTFVENDSEKALLIFNAEIMMEYSYS